MRRPSLEELVQGHLRAVTLQVLPPVLTYAAGAAYRALTQSPDDALPFYALIIGSGIGSGIRYSLGYRAPIAELIGLASAVAVYGLTGDDASLLKSAILFLPSSLLSTFVTSALDEMRKGIDTILEESRSSE